MWRVWGDFALFSEFSEFHLGDCRYGISNVSETYLQTLCYQIMSNASIRGGLLHYIHALED